MEVIFPNKTVWLGDSEAISEREGYARIVQTDPVVVATNDESTPPPPSHSSLAARKEVPQQQHRWLGSNYLDNDIHNWKLVHRWTWRTSSAGGAVKGLLGCQQSPAVAERRGSRAAWHPLTFHYLP